MTRSPTSPASNIVRANQLSTGAHYQLADHEFRWLRDLLAAYCGIYLDQAQQRMVEQAVALRMDRLNIAFPNYERRLAVDQGELRQLSERILNHETYFFRNRPHMRALHEVLLLELHRRKPIGEPLRIWSAGCATGEEAYSLAITALDVLAPTNRAIEIWATDLSDAALDTARTGVYTGRSLSHVEPGTLEQHFVPHENGYQVNQRVRALVTFEQFNLLDALPARVALTDIVFCQNVLIYFQPATSRALLRKLFEVLPEGALLFLGFSETLWTMFDAFRTREVLGAYVYYKEAFSAPVKPADSCPAVAPKRHGSMPRSQPPSQPTHVPTLAQDDQGLLLQAQALIAAGSGDAALPLLQSIQPPLASTALTMAARLHADRGQLATAIAAAERALMSDPMYGEAALLLGMLHSGQGQWAAATAQFERARYLNPASPLISFHLAEALRQRSHMAYALREYRNALWKLDPHPPDMVFDGVTVGWLRETCRRQITQLSQHQSER